MSVTDLHCAFSLNKHFWSACQRLRATAFRLCTLLVVILCQHRRLPSDHFISWLSLLSLSVRPPPAKQGTNDIRGHLPPPKRPACVYDSAASHSRGYFPLFCPFLDLCGLADSARTSSKAHPLSRHP